MTRQISSGAIRLWPGRDQVQQTAQQTRKPARRNLRIFNRLRGYWRRASPPTGRRNWWAAAPQSCTRLKLGKGMHAHSWVASYVVVCVSSHHCSHRGSHRRAIEANDRRHPIAWPTGHSVASLLFTSCGSCRYRTSCRAQTSSAVRLISPARFHSCLHSIGAVAPNKQTWSATHCVKWTWKIGLGHHELIAYQSPKTFIGYGGDHVTVRPDCLADCPHGGLPRTILLPWCSGRDCETEARRPSGSS